MALIYPVMILICPTLLVNVEAACAEIDNHKLHQAKKSRELGG